MKRASIKHFGLIAVALFSFNSCDFFDQFFSIQNKKNFGEIIAEGTIDEHGGTLYGDSVKIVIPEGFFSTPQDIQLVKLPVDSLPISNANSGYYQLRGMIEPIDKPLSISILPNKMIDQNENKLIIAETNIPGYPECYSRIPIVAIDSSGWITSRIMFEKYPDDAIKSYELKSNAGAYEYSWFAMTGSKLQTSHFDIYYDKTDGIANIQNVGADLENSVAIFESMGFSVKIKNGEVYVWKIKDDGGVQQSWKTGKIHMEINNILLKTPEDLKVTIGHELFHWIQYSYDQAFWSGLKNIWLNEAFAVWSESLFATNPEYVPQILQANRLEPCQGLQAGAGRIDGELGSLSTLAENHGYGSASLIKYLVKKYGMTFPLKVYSEVKNGIPPVYAIHKAIGYQLASEWDIYLTEMMYNKIYPYANSFYSQVLMGLSGDFDIFSPDTSFVIKLSYPDLSAKFFKIQPQKKFILANPNLKLKLKLDKENFTNLETISVFKLNKDKQIELMGISNDSIVVGDFSEDYYLFAMVSNSNFNDRPLLYTNNRDIILTIETIGEPAGCQGGLFFDAVMKITNADGVKYDSLKDFFILFPFIESMTTSGIKLGFAQGEMKGNQYKSNWNERIQIGATSDYNLVKGSLSVMFNEQHDLITELILTDTTQYVSNSGTVFYHENIHCTNIPIFEKKNTEITFKTEGANVSGNIQKLDYDELYPDGSIRKLVSYSSSTGSLITVIFKGEDLK